MFEFERGTLLFTEAGSKKRASLSVVLGRAALQALDRGGLDPLDATLEQFRASIVAENHTLKRSLTDRARLDRAAAGRGGRSVSGESHGVS